MLTSFILSKSIGIPASLAIAARCRTVFEEHPRAISDVRAFSNASIVNISLGLMSFSTRSIILEPASLASLLLSANTVGIVPFPGRASPIASDKQFIEFAVNIPEQDPHPGHAVFSSSVNSSSVILPLFTAPTPSNTVIRSIFLPSLVPESIGPPLIIIVGMFILAAAINIAGTVLSQFGIITKPSSA